MAIARKMELLIIDPNEDKPWRIADALSRLEMGHDLIVFERGTTTLVFDFEETGAYNYGDSSFWCAVRDIIVSANRRREK